MGSRFLDKKFVSIILAISSLPYWQSWQEQQSHGRNLLSRLYRAIAGANEAFVINKFEKLTENELDAMTQRQGALLDLEVSDFWEVGDQADILFERALVALRYIDQSLHEAVGTIWEFNVSDFITDDEHLVIPCRKFSRARLPKVGQSFTKRGLLFHRILPIKHSGQRLYVHSHPDVRSDGPDDLPKRNVGAALFPPFHLSKEFPNPESQDFSIVGIETVDDHTQIILEQCLKAVAENCDLLVWPELTMPPQYLHQVTSLLQNSPLRGPLPPIVVGGSWHIEENRCRFNRSSVLDGRGDELFVFDKCVPFMDRPNGATEAIKYGQGVHLLIADGELIVFFICLDFCHIGRTELVEACDASLAVIPSMGGTTTLNAHLDVAKRINASRGTKTVVVQQKLRVESEVDDDTIGYVLLGSKAPRTLKEAALLTTQIFTTFHTDE